MRLQACCLLLVSYFTAAPVWAVELESQEPQESQESKKPAYGAGIRLASRLTDNARKLDDERADERQDEIDANIYVNWQKRKLNFQANYTASLNSFDKGSQENRSTLDGAANLFLGGKDDVLDLLISHSRRSQYKTPESVELNENLDEREIIGVTPTLKATFSPVDTLAVQGDFRSVEYKYNDLQDSERMGGMVYWDHRLAQTDSFRISGGSTSIEYPNTDQNDFKIDYVNVTYTAQLRSLYYSLMAGVNKAAFDDDSKDFQSPTYRGAVAYVNGPHSLALNFSQEITDSSFGDGNKLDFDPEPGGDGVGADQIERQALGLEWKTAIFCVRCNGTFFVEAKKDRYRRLDENNEEISAGVQLNYRVTERVTLTGSYGRLWQRFEVERRPDYTRDMASLRLAYRLGAHLTSGLFYEFERRENTSQSGGYYENAVGLSISYLL